MSLPANEGFLGEGAEPLTSQVLGLTQCQEWLAHDSRLTSTGPSTTPTDVQGAPADYKGHARTPGPGGGRTYPFAKDGPASPSVRIGRLVCVAQPCFCHDRRLRPGSVSTDWPTEWVKPERYFVSKRRIDARPRSRHRTSFRTSAGRRRMGRSGGRQVSCACSAGAAARRACFFAGLPSASGRIRELPREDTGRNT